MTNEAYHKLCYEFDLNYNYQDGFHEYCDDLGIMYVDSIYGNTTARTNDMKSARDYWKKNHKVWLKNNGEVDEYIDKMPMGGYKTEKDAQKVLSEYRKKMKAKYGHA